MAQHHHTPASAATITPAAVAIAFGTLCVCAFMVFMLVYVTQHTPDTPWRMFR